MSMVQRLESPSPHLPPFSRNIHLLNIMMHNFVEEPENYAPEDSDESLNGSQDDNHSTPNYTSNGGSNWRRNTYAPPCTSI